MTYFHYEGGTLFTEVNAQGVGTMIGLEYEQLQAVAAGFQQGEKWGFFVTCAGKGNGPISAVVTAVFTG